MTEDRSDDISHLTDVSVSEDKDLLKNINNEGLRVEDFQTFDQDIRKLKDSTDFEMKKTSFQINHGVFTGEHIKLEALQNGEGFTFLSLK